MKTLEDDGNPPKLIRLDDVCRLKWLPRRRRGRKLSTVTVWRWAAKGIKGIRLQICRVGRVPATTETWLRAFFDAVAAANAAAGPVPTIRSPHRRAKAIARAKAELETAGV